MGLRSLRIFSLRRLRGGYLPSMRAHLLEVRQLRFLDNRGDPAGALPGMRAKMRVQERDLLHPGMRRPGSHRPPPLSVEQETKSRLAPDGPAGAAGAWRCLATDMRSSKQEGKMAANGKKETSPSGPGRGGGRGRQGGRFAAGPGGLCRCPACGQTIPHQRGVPCFESVCPNCGTKMIRG